MHTSIPQARPADPKIDGIAARHQREAEALLPVLQQVHADCGPLTAARIGDVARAMDLPAERVAGVASFYSMLSADRSPETTIRVCDGVVCWLKEAGRCRAALEAAARPRRPRRRRGRPA
jgi:NADH:ubiquinone oxidoreductase subunit E